MRHFYFLFMTVIFFAPSSSSIEIRFIFCLMCYYALNIYLLFYKSNIMLLGWSFLHKRRSLISHSIVRNIHIFYSQSNMIIVFHLLSYSIKKFKICIVGGGIKVHSTLRPLNGLLCHPRVIMIMEKSVEWLARETEVLGENLPQCRFVHHKPHMLPVREPGPPRWEASV
jgi:hypothetical protein